MIVKGVFCDGVILPALGVIGFALARSKPPKAETSAVANSPATETEDSGELESPELQALRALHQVNLVEEKYEGFGIVRVPDGVYGFTCSPHNEAPLFQKKDFRSFEMHGLADGEIYLIGYVSEEEAQKLSNENDRADVSLYPDAWRDAVRLVSIRRSRLIRSKGPSRDEGNAVSLELAPLNEMVN